MHHSICGARLGSITLSTRSRPLRGLVAIGCAQPSKPCEFQTALLYKVASDRPGACEAITRVIRTAVCVMMAFSVHDAGKVLARDRLLASSTAQLCDERVLSQSKANKASVLSYTEAVFVLFADQKISSLSDVQLNRPEIRIKLRTWTT